MLVSGLPKKQAKKLGKNKEEQAFVLCDISFNYLNLGPGTFNIENGSPELEDCIKPRTSGG